MFYNRYPGYRTKKQCSGSVTFCDGSGPLDLYSGLRIRILLFSSVVSKTPTKNYFTFLLLLITCRLKITSHQEVTKQLKSRSFLIFGLLKEGFGAESVQVMKDPDPGGPKHLRIRIQLLTRNIEEDP
jgi:hypothetical protein